MMTKDKISSFLGAFSRLKEKVLWKFEADALEAPKNVFVFKWLPQSDVLG